MRAQREIQIRWASGLALKSEGEIFGNRVRYVVITSSRPGRRFGEKKLPQKVNSLSSAGSTSGCPIKYLYREVVPAFGTPPMIKWGRQLYLWSTNTGTQRGSYAVSDEFAESAACIAA